MAFNQGVYDFVVAYLNDPQTIINQMVRLNVNVEQLADAIGMPTSQVINYFNNAGLQAPGMGYQEPGVEETPVVEQPSEPVVQAPEPSPAPQPEPAPVVEQPAVVDTFPARYAEMQGILSGIAGTGPADFEWWARNKTPDEARALVAQRYAQMESILKQLPNVGPADFQWWTANKTLDEATNFVSQQKPTEVAPPVVTDQEVLDQVAQDQSETIEQPAQPSPTTTATTTAPTSATTASQDVITDYRGNEYKVQDLLKLANQVLDKFNFDLSTGGAFTTKEESIGFDYSEVKKALGEDAKITAIDQVALDIARNLLDKNINDLSLLEGAKKVIPANTRGGANYLVPDRPGLESFPLDSEGNRVITGLQQDGIRLGETAAGDGKTVYYVDLSSGSPSVKTKAIETSDRDTALFVVSMALMAFPGAGTAIGNALGASGTTATALGNAIINAGTSVAAGVPVETAIKNAAVTFGVSQTIPNLTGNAYVDNAVRAVATSALTGGDVQTALTNSLISTGAIESLGNASITGDRVIDSGIVSSLTSAAQAAVNGGDIGQSAVQGFVSGANAALAQKPVTEIPGTSTTIGGGTATGTVVGGATQDLGMDTAVSGAQDDVLGIVAQEQEADRVASASQVLQAPGQMQKVTAEDAAILGLTPLYEQYQGPNGTLYMRDINTGKITQVLPQGAATNVAGGSVFLDKPQVIGAIEALPANALYQGVLYTNDPSLIGKAITSDVLNNISISSERDFNIRPVGNLEITQNADGSYTQKDKVTGDTVTYGADNKIISQTKSAYTKANEVANAVVGTAQAGLGELGAAISATAQQLGVDSQSAIDQFKAIQTSGELMRPEYVNQQSQSFVDEIYRVASDPNSTTEQIARAIASAALNNPAGAAAILGSELIQELPGLLLPGGKVAQFLGSMALNAAESAGAQALQKIDELKAANPNATPQELARMARQDAGVAGAVTAAIGLIPGANNVVARTLLEPVTEALEEGLIEYITTGDANAAKGKAVLGAVIGGKTAAAINTGEELATAVQNNFGAQVPGGVAAPPGASITVTAPTLPGGSTVNPEVDLTPDNLGTLPTTLPDVPEFEVAPEAPTTGVVVEVNPDTNETSVIDSNGNLSVIPGATLTPGEQVQIPATPTAPETAAPTEAELRAIVIRDAIAAVYNNPSLTPYQKAQLINQAAAANNVSKAEIASATGIDPATVNAYLNQQPPAEAPVVSQPVVDAGATPEQAPSITEGVVLQDNGDGTSLVLTQDGGATNVPSVDASTGLALAPGTSVTVDTSNNTATATGTDTSTATSAETTASADTGVTTSTGTTTETATGAETASDTGTVTDTATGVDTQTDTQTGVDTTTQTQTQTQPETQTQTQPETVTQTQPETVTQVTPEPTPQINTEEPKPSQPEDLIWPPLELTPEDQLLQQIIKELEKPTVPTPPPPPIEPPPFTPPESVVETPPVTVEQRLTVSPRTVRPTVMPGSRVEETAQILPIRPGLSEGGTGGIEGTPEEEQQPVWNVRSLKLRRLLGI